MVYEVNLQLKFLPSYGETPYRSTVRKRAYSSLRHRSCKRSSNTDNYTQKTFKTKKQ